MDIFDILGPVMVGPSSSHTAGAARIGAMARTLLGLANRLRPPKQARAQPMPLKELPQPIPPCEMHPQLAHSQHTHRPAQNPAPVCRLTRWAIRLPQGLHQQLLQPIDRRIAA